MLAAVDAAGTAHGRAVCTCATDAQFILSWLFAMVVFSLVWAGDWLFAPLVLRIWCATHQGGFPLEVGFEIRL
jgi:hypothetical protein